MTDQQYQAIQTLCEQLNVSKLTAFESPVKMISDTSYHTNFIVDFNERDPLQYADRYFKFKFTLVELLNSPLIILEYRAENKKNILDHISEKGVCIFRKKKKK